MKRHRRISLQLSKDFKTFRKKYNMTVREIEKRTGISNAFISQFENGLTDISYGRAVVLKELMDTVQVCR